MMRRRIGEDRKGQAAFEYLTTYGWVFLVILIGTGALAYFGYLDPQNFIPDRCWFGTQLICEDYELTRTNPSQSTLRWKVRNNLAKSIEITGFEGLDSRYPLTGCSTGVRIGVGEIRELDCIVDAPLFRGDKYAIPLKVEFRRNESVTTPRHNLSGEIFTLAK